MITSDVIITCIICFTILCVTFIICYYNNKDTNRQKITDVISIIKEFKYNYIIYNNKTDKYEFNGKNVDIVNIINNIYDIL